jgi:hypothetical protein
MARCSKYGLQLAAQADVVLHILPRLLGSGHAGSCAQLSEDAVAIDLDEVVSPMDGVACVCSILPGKRNELKT